MEAEPAMTGDVVPERGLEWLGLSLGLSDGELYPEVGELNTSDGCGEVTEGCWSCWCMSTEGEMPREGDRGLVGTGVAAET